MNELLSYLPLLIFDENPSVHSLMQLVAILAVFWFFYFEIFSNLFVRHFLKAKPTWIIRLANREYDNGAKEDLESIGLKLSREEYIDFVISWYPETIAMLTQHMIGGLFCAPSLCMGWSFFSTTFGVDKPMAVGLACLSILSEMGYEVMDLLRIFFKRLFTKAGKVKYPAFVIALLCVHHALACTMGIPAILKYRDFKVLHWLSFDLQVAAGVAGSVAEYCKMLDITKENELQQFIRLTFFALIIMVWTRGFHWVYICYIFLTTWYQEKEWILLSVGSIILCLFSFFSYFMCIDPFAQRLKKFLKKKAEYNSLPSDVPIATRRATMKALQKSARHVYTDEMREEKIRSMFIDRKVSKRQSLPPMKLNRQTSLLLAARARSVATFSPMFNEMAKKAHD